MLGKGKGASSSRARNQTPASPGPLVPASPFSLALQGWLGRWHPHKETRFSVSNLRINLADMLHARTVESERIEFKATWDPRVTGYQVLKTICAFANDLRRHGSGYIILGVAERNGRAQLPPGGLTAQQIEGATPKPVAFFHSSLTSPPRYHGTPAPP